MKRNITEQSAKVNRHVAKNIRRLRKARHITAVGMAELLGITKDTYVRIERGEWNVHLARIYQLADILHCMPKEITEGALEVYRAWQKDQASC